MTLASKKNSYDTPSFCVIAPTAYLPLFGNATATHLVLAHLVDTDEKYANFYLQCSKNGDLIIMDNGAFELGESYNPERLIELGHRCGADAIVLPDYPFQDPSVTIAAAEKWIPVIKEAGFDTMFVPQSETDDMEGWMDAYHWAAQNDDIDIIGMSILGIPNANTNIPAAYARVVMTQLLIDRHLFNHNKHHHYLGLNAGPALEIPALIKMDALDTCDSSGPVWAAILGHEYVESADSFQLVKKIKAHVQFDYPLTKDEETLDRIANNLTLTLSLFA